jgi:hypothetical protein
VHFLCMHDSGHTHQVKHRILRIQVCIEHQHWAHAQLCICTRKASWGGEQGTRVHTTLLRAELPGRIGIGDHAIWKEFYGGQEPLHITDLWLSRRGHGIVPA